MLNSFDDTTLANTTNEQTKLMNEITRSCSIVVKAYDRLNSLTIDAIQNFAKVEAKLTLQVLISKMSTNINFTDYQKNVDAIYQSVLSLLVQINNNPDLIAQTKQTTTAVLSNVTEDELAEAILLSKKHNLSAMTVARAREILGLSAIDVSDQDIQDNISFLEALADMLLVEIDRKIYGK